MEINRKSSIPVYSQIANYLRSLLEDLRVKGRVKFYTDDELIKMFKVSRMTIRQAVQVLVNEGLLYRSQGKGTFIKKEKMSTDIEKLETFFSGWYLDQNFSVEVLFNQIVPCPKQFAEKLSIMPYEEVVLIKRRRLSKNVPVVLDVRYIKKDFGIKLDANDLNLSLSHAFLKEFDLSFSEGVIEIEAVSADEEISKILNIPIGFPVLHRNVELKVKQFGCIVTGFSIYRGDMYKYKSILRAEN